LSEEEKEEFIGKVKQELKDEIKVSGK